MNHNSTFVLERRYAGLDMEVIDYLRHEAKRARYWHSVGKIASGTHHAHPTCKQSVFRLIQAGYLIVRDSDAGRVGFLVALKPSLRDQPNKLSTF
jgi:hypothetical protein